MSPIASAITWLRERPQLLRGFFYALLGCIVLYDVFAPRHEAHFWGDNVRGFWALYGLLGSLGMAKFMKGIGHAWLMKPVDFWNRTGEE